MKTISALPSQPTDLQRDIAARILQHARDEGLDKGDPIRESRLAKKLSVSRTPVRTALNYLCDMAVVEHVPRRGYVLAIPARELPEIERAKASEDDDNIYDRLVDLYFKGQLPTETSEAELMRRLDVERSALQRVLVRLKIEGIIRQRPGYGWHFEPLLRTKEADEESYRFRLLIEPAGLLQPTFKADVDRLGEIRAQQQVLLTQSASTLKSSKVFDANQQFHGALAEFSGNRFIEAAVAQQARMRRLVEYRHYLNVERVRSATQDHILMIDYILDARLDAAAALMTQHIASALDTMIDSERH